MVDRGLADAGCASDDPVVTQGANADGDGTCGFTGATDQSGVADLGLGAVGEFGGATPTIRPQPTSPLLDTEAVGATTCAVPDADQRGRARPAGSACDTGAVELQGRADALIRKGTQAFVGNDVYGGDGRGQNVSVTVRRGQAVLVSVRVQNEGERPDRLRLLGAATNGAFTVAYAANHADITGPVGAGTFLTPVLAPGAGATIQMAVTPRSTTAVGVTRNLLVTATSDATATAKDAVAVNVRVVA